ncbi:MAG: BCCT family transporter [Desulfobacterales bacterium]|nr:BCCT family transporter [Desulfobacterales bacterium]
MSNGKSFQIDKGVFWPPFIALLVVVATSLIADEAFLSMAKTAFNWVNNTFGWAFALSTLVFVVSCMILAFSPAGNIRFGGKDAKPEFSTWNWFAMSLCGGIAIGIVFWGAAEPIYHFASPPGSLGMEAFSAESAKWSMTITFLHWTFSPYSLYVVCAIPIGLAFYNHGQPFAVSSGLYFLMGDKCHGWFGKLVDCLCLFSIACGVTVSLGWGLAQVGSGISFLFGIPSSKFLYGICALVIVATYTVSSYTGIKRGIRILSDNNAKIFMAIMIFVFITGPTLFILDLGVESLGAYITDFFNISLWMGAGTGEQWPHWWSLFYWAVWMAYAPIVGLFLARLVRGRTIRQFVAVNLFAPAIFGMIWFSIFGGAAIEMQLSKTFDLWASISNKGVETTVFAFLEQFPLSGLVIPVFLITVVISFVTLADSMTTCVAAMSTRGMTAENAEAPALLKITWGVVMGLLAFIMISMSGVDGVKMIGAIAGLPIMILMVALLVSTLKRTFWPEADWRLSSDAADSVEPAHTAVVTEQ